MDVKSAVGIAKKFVSGVLTEENVINVGLEEVQYDEEQGVWRITVGFSRPWNTARNALTAITGEPASRRTYRVITVKDSDGTVTSMTRRGSDE